MMYPLHIQLANCQGFFFRSSVRNSITQATGKDNIVFVRLCCPSL